MTEIKYIRARELTENVIEEIANQITTDVLSELQKLEMCIRSNIEAVVGDGKVNCGEYEIKAYLVDHSLDVIENLRESIADKIYKVLKETNHELLHGLSDVQVRKSDRLSLNAKSDRYEFVYSFASIRIKNVVIYEFLLEAIRVKH